MAKCDVTAVLARAADTLAKLSPVLNPALGVEAQVADLRELLTQVTAAMPPSASAVSDLSRLCAPAGWQVMPPKPNKRMYLEAMATAREVDITTFEGLGRLYERFRACAPTPPAELTEQSRTTAKPLTLTHCTLTGVDEKTSLTELANLSLEYPFVEWGLLYSPTRQGKPGRYPAILTLAHALRSLPPHVRIALHVCGEGVHNLLAGYDNELGLLDLVEARGGRVQLNFNQGRKPVDLSSVAALCTRYPTTTFITQDNNDNLGVWERLAERGVANHAVLFDGSCGRGIPCSTWPRPWPIQCGYAGGLGPDNLPGELARIRAVAGARPTWVDMEGKLRKADANGVDWLDLAACRACLEAVQTHLSGPA